MRAHACCLITGLLSCVPVLATETAVKDIATRPGVTLRVLLIRPEKPVASVILFAGGDGLIGISESGAFARGGNFLVRSRDLFASAGLMVAVLDAPSDRNPGPGLDHFRTSAEHAADVAQVIAQLRKEAPVAVWLVGTSRGTTSVGNAAIRLKQGGPDGIVLTATMAGRNDPGSVDNMRIEEITVPTLLVHHERDECRVTEMKYAKQMLERLAASPKKEFIPVSGGGPPRGKACESRHWHGFVGIESEVVNRIADWIKRAK
jgi:pimeloyl-ACP methyl ester carboxylesterase